MSRTEWLTARMLTLGDGEAEAGGAYRAFYRAAGVSPEAVEPLAGGRGGGLPQER